MNTSKQNPLVLLAFVGIMAIGACSSQHSATSLPPGTYQNSTSNTNAAGTNTSTSTTTNVTEDANGNKTAVIDKSTTTDPKGLFNQRTTKTRQVISDDQ